MNLVKYLATEKWSRWKEVTAMVLVGWVPLSLGRALRRLVYRTILSRLGNAVQIQPGVEWIHAQGIEIGNGVKIDRGVCFKNHGPNSKIRLGDGVKLDIGVILKTHFSGNIDIASNTYIGPYTCLSGNSIKIGKDCRLASHLGIYANNHNFADLNLKIREQGNRYQGIVIGDDCWLGSGVKVVDGVTIGQGSVIGAGAVVTKDIPAYSVAVGVPARAIASRQTTNVEDLEQIEASPSEADASPSIPSSSPAARVEETARLIHHCLQSFANTIPTQAESLHPLLDCIRQAMAADTIALLLPTETGQQLAVYAAIGLKTEMIEGIRIPLGHGFAGRIAASRKPAIVDDLSRIEVVSHILRNKGIRSMVGVPLLVKNQTGVFHIGTFRSRQFTQDEAQLLQQAADQIGSMISQFNIARLSLEKQSESNAPELIPNRSNQRASQVISAILYGFLKKQNAWQVV